MKVNLKNAKWNGFPVIAEHCKVKVIGDDNFFKWYNVIDGKVVDAIRVTVHGDVFFIYNGDLSGEMKLLSGGGPNRYHKSFENFIIADESEETFIYKDCTTHEWSEDERPVFKTTTLYCKKCRTPKIFENAIKRGF